MEHLLVKLYTFIKILLKEIARDVVFLLRFVIETELVLKNSSNIVSLRTT